MSRYQCGFEWEDIPEKDFYPVYRAKARLYKIALKVGDESLRETIRKYCTGGIFADLRANQDPIRFAELYFEEIPDSEDIVNAIKANQGKDSWKVAVTSIMDVLYRTQDLRRVRAVAEVAERYAGLRQASLALDFLGLQARITDIENVLREANGWIKKADEEYDPR